MRAYYSFYDIIEDVKTDVGFAQMQNLYPMIRKLITRAEYEINPYGGFLIKKRMMFYKGNGNFNGNSIKLPPDFVALDINGIREDGFRPEQYVQTESHLVFTKALLHSNVPFSYWAMNSDSEGNPVVAMNHKEAVVNFIVFKLYSAMVFNKEGNRAQRLDYKQEWEDSCMAARGNDFFPSEMSMHQMNMVSTISSYDRAQLPCIDHATHYYTNLIIDQNTVGKDLVHVFQITNKNHQFEINQLDQLLNDLAFTYHKQEFISGITISFANYGKFCFVVENSNDETIEINDILGVDVSSTMEKHYDYDKKRIIFVSKDPVSPASIYFKITQDNG